MNDRIERKDDGIDWKTRALEAEAKLAVSATLPPADPDHDALVKDATRYRFRHSNFKDAEGYEYGYCKVRWKNGAVDSMLWASDEEIDAAMTANSNIKYSPHREESAVSQVGVCPRCGVNRFEAACPNGHMAETMGQCPMVGTSARADDTAEKP